MNAGYRHLHAAHCETGVAASLLANRGFDVSEPMLFGVGSGLFFFHSPLFRVMGLPLTTFRTWPGAIFRKACRRLGIRYATHTYQRPDKGAAAVQDLLARGVPVGVQVNVFWLPYLPQQFRFQFNAHNVVVTGFDGAVYSISDPLLETTVTCPVDALDRARFARGPLAPRGRLYYPLEVPAQADFAAAIRAGVRDTCRTMLRIPFWGGVSGIRGLARSVRTWPRRVENPQRRRLLLANVVRMQEEIGTGGAGFRFMYAAFLQEAGGLLGHDGLLRASEEMTAAGDLWREFAAGASRICKGRDSGIGDFQGLHDMLQDCARREEAIYRQLAQGLRRDAGPD